jgi:hypothetical protein
MANLKQFRSLPGPKARSIRKFLLAIALAMILADLAITPYRASLVTHLAGVVGSCILLGIAIAWAVGRVTTRA